MHKKKEAKDSFLISYLKMKITFLGNIFSDLRIELLLALHLIQNQLQNRRFRNLFLLKSSHLHHWLGDNLFLFPLKHNLKQSQLLLVKLITFSFIFSFFKY